MPIVIIEFATARRVFHMRDWGNPWGVFLLVTLGIVTFAALGLTVASVTNTAQETQVINQILWIAFLLLSGATLPLPPVLPGWILGFVCVYCFTRHLSCRRTPTGYGCACRPA